MRKQMIGTKTAAPRGASLSTRPGSIGEHGHTVYNPGICRPVLFEEFAYDRFHAGRPSFVASRRRLSQILASRLPGRLHALATACFDLDAGDYAKRPGLFLDSANARPSSLKLLFILPTADLEPPHAQQSACWCTMESTSVVPSYLLGERAGRRSLTSTRDQPLAFPFVCVLCATLITTPSALI